MSKWGVFILAVLALLMTLSYIVISGQQTGEVTKAEFETILIGKGGSTMWSPDGNRIAFISEDRWLCVAHIEAKAEIVNVAPINEKVKGFNWLNDSEFILWEKETQRIEGVLLGPIIRIKKLTLDGKEELIVEDRPGKGEAPRITFPIFLPSGTIGYYENAFEQPTGHITGERTFKVVKFGRLKSDSTQKQMRAYVVPSGSTGAGDIWIESLDGEIQKRITTGRLFSFPELSPDGTKILAVCGSLCGTCVIDLQGIYTCVGKKGYESGDTFSATLGPPNVKWSPDGKKIAYMYMTAIGEELETIGSDIYIENAEGTERAQVTDTPDEFERYPIWSPDGTKIACTGYYSHNIYVIKIK